MKSESVLTFLTKLISCVIMFLTLIQNNTGCEDFSINMTWLVQKVLQESMSIYPADIPLKSVAMPRCAYIYSSIADIHIHSRICTLNDRHITHND